MNSGCTTTQATATGSGTTTTSTSLALSCHRLPVAVHSRCQCYYSRRALAAHWQAWLRHLNRTRTSLAWRACLRERLELAARACQRRRLRLAGRCRLGRVAHQRWGTPLAISAARKQQAPRIGGGSKSWAPHSARITGNRAVATPTGAIATACDHDTAKTRICPSRDRSCASIDSDAYRGLRPMRNTGCTSEYRC
jgi:hypothetical protein